MAVLKCYDAYSFPFEWSGEVFLLTFDEVESASLVQTNRAVGRLKLASGELPKE